MGLHSHGPPATPPSQQVYPSCPPASITTQRNPRLSILIFIRVIQYEGRWLGLILRAPVPKCWSSVLSALALFHDHFLAWCCPSGHDESSGYLETRVTQWQEILGHVSSLRDPGLLSCGAVSPGLPVGCQPSWGCQISSNQLNSRWVPVSHFLLLR